MTSRNSDYGNKIVGYESPIRDTPQTIISFLNSKQIVILMFWTEQETKQRTVWWLTLKQLADDDLIISKNKQSVMSQTYKLTVFDSYQVEHGSNESASPPNSFPFEKRHTHALIVRILPL